MSRRDVFARVVRLQRKAGALRDAGRFDRAESTCLEALDALQAATGTKTPDYANLLNLLGEPGSRPDGSTRRRQPLASHARSRGDTPRGSRAR